MGMKRSLKQILTLMAGGGRYRRSLAVVVTVIMTLQLAAVPVKAAWQETLADDIMSATTGETTEGMDVDSPEIPGLANTYALVVSTGGQAGDAIQYFKVIFEDANGIRRSEYIFKDDNKTSIEKAKEYGNRDARRESAKKQFTIQYQKSQINNLQQFSGLRREKRDTYLFETPYDVKRVVGVEIMQSAGQWDCQGLWIYQVDQIYGEEMYGYVSGDTYIDFSGWRLAELEMTYKNGLLIYTTLQNSRPKIYRMGENGHPEFNLIIYDKSEAKYESTNSGREYAMRLDITDIYGAGIEKLLENEPENGTIGESVFLDSLRMDIRYQDTFGCIQHFSVNVLPSSLLWALDNGVPASTKLAGYAQQGDTLLFPVKIPYFADLLEVSIRCDFPSGIDARDDAMNLSSIAMYDLTLSLADVEVDPERAAIVPSITYNPIYLWKTNSRQGYTMNGDDDYAYDMRLNEDSLAIVDEPLEDEYLVEITTDTMPSAGTTSDVSIVLNYENYGGVEQRTEKIMLREQSKDFHGYTPGGDHMYYWLGMRSGGTLHFRIKIPNVAQFTSAAFELENGSSDEWQMSGIKIYQLEELSKRKIIWGDFTAGEANSDRYYDRTFKGELVFSGTRSMLVQAGSTGTVDTSEGGAFSESTLPDSSVAWRDIKYSMSYDEALQNIGFAATRNTYQVDVTVAGNSAISGTEDSGSKNLFYFQLVFEDGSSGYVLANQQLSGDGFRTGYTESFTIKTNQEYGELVSVRIIPEDVSTNSDYFDKLNIDSIQVVRRSDGGLSRQWSLDRVGWIDIDFRDEGAANGMLGQKGRTEEELARSFNVTYSTYAVNLLVSITTLGLPFTGTVYGDMCYYNNAGEVKHKGFDIVALMYEYANIPPQYYEGNALSNSSMFQADRTDRFIITLSDVHELAYLDIDALMYGLQTGQGGTWHIGGMAVSLIESEGELLLNENDEYERNNTVSLLTSNVDTGRTPAYQLLMESGAKTSQRIYFVENEIELNIERGDVSVLSREPISQNDILNIYVYPDLESSEPSTGYTVKAAATYTSPSGMRQASAGTLNMSSDGSMFYMIGVKASGMTVLNELALQADNPERIPHAYIDRAIVQQVRSGVVINTYEFDYHGSSIVYGQSTSPITEAVEYKPAYTDEQIVMFSIGEGIVDPVMLQPETKDLAVALRYVPEHDPEGYEQQYDSPFIYLTDQQVSMLRSGQLVTLTFNEGYVKEITGLVLVATGGLTVPIEMACAGNYRVVTATRERIERGWYSFSEFVDSMVGTEVGRTDRHLGYIGDSVKPLKLQFTTAPAAEDMESGVSGPVEVTISYVDDYGTVRTKTIPDLRLYATTSAPFATDSVTDVELLVVGMKELRWIQVRPYDDNAETDIGWKLSAVNAQLGVDGEVQKRIVDNTKAIRESAGHKINYSTISVEVNVKAQSNTGESTDIDVLNETEDILLDSGRSAKMVVTVNGSDEGFTVTAERASALDSTATADAGDFLTRNGDTLTFNPDRNYTGAAIYYRITVTSVEVGTKTVINFVQLPEKETETGSRPAESVEKEDADSGAADDSNVADGSGTADDSNAVDGSGAADDSGSETSPDNSGETP